MSPDSVSPEPAPVGLLGGVLVGEWGAGARLAPKDCLFHGDRYPREVGRVDHPAFGRVRPPGIQ